MEKRLRLTPACLLLLATSCYSFIGRYEKKTTAQTPDVDNLGRKYWYVSIAKQAVPRRENYAAELFACKPAQATIIAKNTLAPMQRPGEPRNVTPSDATDGVLVFRVGFISDVHIRQASVKLFSKDLSRELRYVVDSFERNGYQEAFQPAVFAATISAFNNLDSVENKPRLIVNTGDATDAGTIEEAYDFASVAHHLRYPMLYAIGNHDDAIFGNYKPKLGYTKNAGPVFYPVGQRQRFMRYFNGLETIGGFSDGLVPLPADYDKADLDARWAALDVPRETNPGIEDDKPFKTTKTCVLAADGSMPNAPAGACKIKTYCSGFDLNGTKPADLKNCQDYAGYYAVVVPGDDGKKVQLIALNTTHGEDEWGADATFDETQRNWLSTQLATQPPPDVTIIFMHHRPANVPGLIAVLDDTASKRPLVVLSGHTHSHATEWRGHFWELNTGSLEEFPQWARLVEIRRGPNGRYYLNARVLKPALTLLDPTSDPAKCGLPAGSPEAWDTLSRAEKERLVPWFEAQFAACDGIAEAGATQTLCKQDPESKERSGTLLHDSARCGYLGALYDHVMVLTSSQSGGSASVQANVVVDISP
ncbi:MAG: metallophosphoesterase family protein [Polyangia bacterium]|jgi:predicted phosphodiesterase